MKRTDDVWHLDTAIRQYSDLEKRLAGTDDQRHYKWVKGLVKALEELKERREGDKNGTHRS